jgi:hypothetical protein
MQNITVHHVRRFGEPKNDRRAIPLCAPHHLHDASPWAIERIGKERFQDMFDLDLEKLIVDYNVTAAVLGFFLASDRPPFVL